MITLTLDAPGKNALGTQLMTWLIDELAKAGGEPVKSFADERLQACVPGFRCPDAKGRAER